ncbi:hypothetical protein [Microbacterium oxydans]|uniref:hypothetical protein n=1 Tax=Microbacterium oxydans TaxID=82380 RepID=UPI0012E0336A|nr:hypothetical protein [Microbacterium oxydans]
MRNMTDAAETANHIAELALVVSSLAAFFALLAAAFTGWQAIILHLERTKPRPAAFAFLPAAQGQPRLIKNEGGSAAHSIQVFAWGVPLARKDRRAALRIVRNGVKRRYESPGEPITGAVVDGSLAAGEHAPLRGTGPRAEMVGPPRQHGVGGLDLMYSPALVCWQDGENRQRHDWVPLR